MMNMALCTAIHEGEHGASRVYGDILARWPYALEVAYEVVKVNGNLDSVINGLKVRLSAPLREGTEAEKCTHLATGALLEGYKRWNQQLVDHRGGRVLWQESEIFLVEALKKGNYWSELDGEENLGQEKVISAGVASKGVVSGIVDSNPGGLPLVGPVLPLKPIRSVNDPMKYLSALLQELYRGNYLNMIAIMEWAKGVDHAPWFGLEYFGWALLRTSNRAALTSMATILQRLCPSRWETWYVSALKEWMTPPRNVVAATELLQRCILAQPTHPLILITKAYMHVYRVKDSLLHYFIDQNTQHKRQMAIDARFALEASREAFSYSKDPFTTCSLLHIFSLLSVQIPDAKYLEVLGEVEGLNPLFKRYKKNPSSILQYAQDAPITAEHIATANATLLQPDSSHLLTDHTDENKAVNRAKLQNAHLASLYARLLAYRAKMCVAKLALVSMAHECAEHALKLDPKNAVANCALIVSSHIKRADWNGALDKLNSALQKADSQEAQLVYRLEILQTLENLGEPDPQAFAEISGPMLTANPMDEDAVYWSERVNLKIRCAEEDVAEEEELGAEGVV